MARAFRSLLRWWVLFLAATLGSWAGQVAAARLHGEPVGSLLRLDPRSLLEQDVTPGLLAAELLGKPLGLSVAGEAVLAAAGAAAAAVATGPYVVRDYATRRRGVAVQRSGHNGALPRSKQWNCR